MYVLCLVYVRTMLDPYSVLRTDLWLMLMSDMMHSFYVVKWYEFCMVNVRMYITLSKFEFVISTSSNFFKPSF